MYLGYPQSWVLLFRVLGFISYDDQPGHMGAVRVQPVRVVGFNALRSYLLTSTSLWRTSHFPSTELLQKLQIFCNKILKINY